MLPECSGVACPAAASPPGYMGTLGQTLIRTPAAFVFIDAAYRCDRMEPPGANQYDHEHTIR